MDSPLRVSDQVSGDVIYPSIDPDSKYQVRESPDDPNLLIFERKVDYAGAREEADARRQAGSLAAGV